MDDPCHGERRALEAWESVAAADGGWGVSLWENRVKSEGIADVIDALAAPGLRTRERATVKVNECDRCARHDGL